MCSSFMCINIIMPITEVMFKDKDGFHYKHPNVAALGVRITLACLTWISCKETSLLMVVGSSRILIHLKCGNQRSNLPCQICC